MRAGRRTRLVLVLSLLAATALLGTAAWVLLGTTLFGVRVVEVSGTDRVAPATVRAAAAIDPGTPLARLDTAAVAERLGRLPAVRTVQVTRTWPRTVTIQVSERRPAAVQSRGPAYLLIDRAGVAFDTVPRRPRGLPLVSAPVDAGRPALRAAITVLDQLPPKVRQQVLAVRATSVEDVEVRLRRGRTVLWGSTERAERKATVLTALVGRKARVYDVSAPDAPTTRR